MMGGCTKAEAGPEPGLTTTGPCIGYSRQFLLHAEVGSLLGSDDEFARRAAFRLDHCGRRLSAECEKCVRVHAAACTNAAESRALAGLVRRLRAADLSCVPNWSSGFRWIRQGPTAAATAEPAKQFCETVWDGESKWVPDGSPCFPGLDWSTDHRKANSETWLVTESSMSEQSRSRLRATTVCC
uniref:C-type lectin domain-containing protein n=1 Tax=Macrostomum lignano TaxID=282301 RepID=A0A1I8F416_9PLAT